MRWLLATALLARSAAADPALDYQRAKLHALTAHNLAYAGYCAEALALRPRIEALDAEVARVAYAEDAALVACEKGPGFGPPSLAPLVVPAPPPRRSCSTRGYLEPSLLGMFDSITPTVFTRVAAGVLIRGCTSPVQVRIGATTYIGHVGEIGVGLETEVTEALAADLRLGFHVAYESAQDGALESADLRLHIQDTAWLQVGAFAWSRYDDIDSGVSVGVGFEGTPGAILGGAELGLGAALLVAVISELSRDGD